MKLQKTTTVRPDGQKRRYDDACGTAHALDLIGERWALLVMRELMLGPKRFSELRADLPGISANVLTQRLTGLEEAGLLIRRRLPPPASAQVYELTPWGYEAGPLIQDLGRWAARSPAHDPTLPLSAVSLMMSFRTMFDPELAKGLEIEAGFALGRESFVLRIAAGDIFVERGAPVGTDFVFAGRPEAIAAIVYGGLPIDQADVKLTGDRAKAERFTGLFRLPPKAEMPR